MKNINIHDERQGSGQVPTRVSVSPCSSRRKSCGENIRSKPSEKLFQRFYNHSEKTYVVEVMFYKHTKCQIQHQNILV